MASDLSYTDGIWVSSFGMPDILFHCDEDLQPATKKRRLDHQYAENVQTRSLRSAPSQLQSYDLDSSPASVHPKWELCDSFTHEDEVHVTNTNIRIDNSQEQLDPSPTPFVMEAVTITDTVPSLIFTEGKTKIRISCSMCSKTFHTRSGMIKHLRKIHQNATTSPSRPNPDRPKAQKGISCPLCERGFTSKQDLHVHQVTQACTRADRLLRRITGGWSCTICDKIFNSRNHAERHTRTHEHGRGMLCPVCSEDFTGCKGNVLVKHVKEQHPTFLMI